jgi:hypothetical protein
MENKTKLYVGNAKQKTIQTPKGPMDVIKVGFKKSDLELMMSKLNENGYVNLDVTKRLSEGKYGETHSIVIDEWKPKASQATAATKSNIPSSIERNSIASEDDGDLPF